MPTAFCLYSFGQVDLKILYAELIRLLVARDRELCREGVETVKSVGRIEGFQELTNRLQLGINRRFLGQLQAKGMKYIVLNDIYRKLRRRKRGWSNWSQNVKV